MKTSLLICFAAVFSCYALSSCTLSSVCIKTEDGGYNIVEDYDSARFVTREFDMTGFYKVEAHGYAMISYKQSETYSVVARSTEEMFEKTKISSTDSKLVFDQRGAKILNAPVMLTIWAPDIKEFNLGGNVELVAGGVQTSGDFDLYVTGAGKVEFGSLECNKFKADLSGASKFDGKIKADGNVDIEFSGAAKSDIDVEAKALNVDCSGAVKLDLNFNGENANVDCSGASVVNMGFTGNIVKYDCSGASKIESTLQCKDLSVDLSGASVFKASGVAEKTHFETSGASSINTKELNNY